MRKAARASVPETTTTQESHSVRTTTRSVTPFLASSGTFVSPRFAIGKNEQQSDSGESIWGWAKRIHFSAKHGWTVEED